MIGLLVELREADMDQLILLSQGLFLAGLGLGAWLCFQSAKKTDAETLDGNEQIPRVDHPGSTPHDYWA